MLLSGERQVAPTLDGIRADHRARYAFAVERLTSPSRALVLDAGCGIGYGARMLAEAGLAVWAHDCDPEAIAYGRAHYDHPAIRWSVADVCTSVCRTPAAAVAFEVLEHLARLGLALIRFPDYLIASVPNRAVLPKVERFPHHVRHYDAQEFELLLAGAGYRVTAWWTQPSKRDAAPMPGTEGRTLIALCAR